MLFPVVVAGTPIILMVGLFRRQRTGVLSDMYWRDYSLLERIGAYCLFHERCMPNKIAAHEPPMLVSSSSTGRWIRCQRPVPAAVGEHRTLGIMKTPRDFQPAHQLSSRSSLKIRGVMFEEAPDLGIEIHASLRKTGNCCRGILSQMRQRRS